MLKSNRHSCRSPPCRFTSPTPTPYAYPPLCMSCRLSPLRYYLDTSIQQDVCRRLIPGTYISAHSPPSPSSFISNVIFILLTELQCCVMLFSLYSLFNQRACGTIFPSLAKSTHAPSFGTPTASRSVLPS